MDELDFEKLRSILYFDRFVSFVKFVVKFLLMYHYQRNKPEYTLYSMTGVSFEGDRAICER
jgi:hypothetical protein